MPTRRAEPAAVRTPLSLKQHLFMWLLLALLVAVPVGSLALYSIMRSTAMDWLDESLGDTALALANLVRVGEGQPAVDLSAQTDLALRFDRVDRVFYVVLDAHGKAIHGDAWLAAVNISLAPGKWHFSDTTATGELLRVGALGLACGDAGTCQVRVAETQNKRDTVRHRLLLAATGTMLLLAVVMALAGRVAIAQGLRPLGRLSAEVEDRNLDRLEPLTEAVPSEVRPLIAAINRLFERLTSAASAQQEFLANAAHQLRTPLTSLRTDIDLALLEPHDARVEPLLKKLQASADRSARLAHQMLAVARADGTPVDRNQAVDLREVATQVADDWVPRAMAAGLDLGFELQAAPASGEPFLLRELLENLVHNSVNYAGPGARITVRTHGNALESVLEVEDNGPGIPVAERAAALQRFQRGRAASGQGSGLGLAIARNIAASHDGRFELLDGEHGRGLRVRLTLPRRAAMVAA